jgi:hypothetical protein
MTQMCLLVKLVAESAAPCRVRLNGANMKIIIINYLTKAALQICGYK